MRSIGILLIVLALVAAIVPQVTDCQSQGKVITLANGRTIPMKCHWTGQAELVVATPMIAIGGLMLVNRRKETLRALALLGILIGIFIVLLPTYLIGVCASTDMLCNSLMKPVLIFSGTVAAVVNLIGFALVGRQADQPITVQIGND